MTPLPGTLRLRPGHRNLLWLGTAALGVLGSVGWVLATGRLQDLGFMVAALLGAAAAGAWVLDDSTSAAEQITAALWGLPQPDGGWTDAETATIAALPGAAGPGQGRSNRGTDGLAAASLASYYLVTATLETSGPPAAAVAAAAIIATAALAGLGVVARRELHRRRRLLPLAHRIALLQSRLVAEAIRQPTPPRVAEPFPAAPTTERTIPG